MKVTDDAAAAVSKRSAMTLFSDSTSHYSHRVRIVLAEKGVSVDLVEGVDGVPVPELGDLNPYNTMPTLIDRDLILYESKVMMEYLDERFRIRRYCRSIQSLVRRVVCLCIEWSAIGARLSILFCIHLTQVMSLLHVEI